MYSTSKVWVNPRIKQDSDRMALNNARNKICRNSDIWYKDFDLKQHKLEWQLGLTRMRNKKLIDNAILRQEAQGCPYPGPSVIRPAFDNKLFSDNRGYVLGYETVFCPTFHMGSKLAIAQWPTKSEAKYEGDDRISTDRLHARFPGAPRVEANETVSWQHRKVIDQFPFDDFYSIPTAVDVFLRTHYVDELEFTDEVGRLAVGNELMDLLDPEDQW